MLHNFTKTGRISIISCSLLAVPEKCDIDRKLCGCYSNCDVMLEQRVHVQQSSSALGNKMIFISLLLSMPNSQYLSSVHVHAELCGCMQQRVHKKAICHLAQLKQRLVKFELT